MTHGAPRPGALTPRDLSRIATLRSRQRSVEAERSKVAADIRTLVLELVENASVQDIADAFGLTRQRIYAIMRG